MKITPKKTRKFQVGGAMPEGAPVEEPQAEAGAPVEETAPAEGEQEDPMTMLFQMAAQALQAQDCQAMAQVCQALLEIGQQMQGTAPEEPLGEPVFARNGAKLTVKRRVRK